MVLTHEFNLDIVKQPLQRLKLVNGDTANQFVIAITNGGEAVTLDTTLHKIVAVFKRADGQVYTQDASTGLSFTTAGVVTIDVYSSSFRTGTNKITLQIYKRENSSATEYPLLLTTQEQTFNARAAAIPDSGAPNAPSQLPMLEGLIADASNAVDACEAATAAANEAASSANEAADAANEAARDAGHAAQEATAATTAANTAASSANTAAQGANAAATAANSAAQGANAASAAANGAAQNANAKASEAAAAAATAQTAAAAAMAAAQIAKKGAYNIKHNATWSGSAAYGYTAETGAEIAQIAQDNVFVTQIANPDVDDQSVITLIEIGRDATSEIIFFRSAQAWDGYIYLATMDYSGNNTAANISFARQVGEPLMLHPTEVQYDTDNNEILSVAFEESASQIIASFDRPMSFYISIPNPPDSGQGAVSNDYLVTVAYKSHFSNDYEMVFILNVPHEMGIYLRVSIVNNAVNARGNYSYAGLL